MEYNYVDHIYDLIEVEPDIIKAVSLLFSDEIEYCKREKQSPIISEIFPLRKYSMWEHQIGLYHLINLCGKSNSLKSNISKKALKMAALIHNMGHAKYGYQLEEVLIFLLSSTGEDYIKERYKNVSNYLPCNNCEKKCLDDFYKNRDYRFLKNLELARYLLLNEEKFKAEKDKNNESFNGINIIDVIKTIVCKKENSYKILNFLDRTDFVLRDLYYLGIINLGVNFQYLLNIYKDKDITDVQELKLINNQVYSYLHNNIYTENKVLILTKLFQNQAVVLLNNKIQEIAQCGRLSDIDIGSINLEKLKERINDYHIIVKFRWYQKKENNLSVEKRLLPIDWDYQTYIRTKKIILCVTDQSPSFASQTSECKEAYIFAEKGLDKFSNVMELFISIKEKINIFRNNNKEFVEKLFSSLFERSVTINHQKYKDIIFGVIEKYCKFHPINELSEIISKIYLDSLHSDLNESLTEDINENEKSLMYELEKLFIKDRVNSFEEGLKNSDYKKVEIIIDFLFFDFQKLHSQQYGKKFIEFLITELKTIIINKNDYGNKSENALELLIFILENKRYYEKQECNFWVVPSVIIDKKKEFDCLVLSYSNKQVKLDIIETTLTNKDNKCIDDLKKNQAIIDELRKYSDIEIYKKIVAPDIKIIVQPLEDIIK